MLLLSKKLPSLLFGAFCISICAGIPAPAHYYPEQIVDHLAGDPKIVATVDVGAELPRRMLVAPGLESVEDVERKRGFVASEALLGNSFAAHLHGEADPQTVAGLSALGAAYDPLAGSGFTAGMLSYHLARPVELLRELGLEHVLVVTGL